jgi:hypothetical protein
LQETDLEAKPSREKQGRILVRMRNEHSQTILTRRDFVDNRRSFWNQNEDARARVEGTEHLVTF